MRHRHWLYFGLAVVLCTLLSGCDFAILDPKGLIAATEKQLFVDATLLMLIVVIPVIILSVLFGFRYRRKNANATYAPTWSHSYAIEFFCWLIPCIIIAILATMTWIYTHRLDPYRSLDKGKPLVIQAVALDWKWLFIYPDEQVAALNALVIPVGQPIEFQITADAPMNSFAIPQLAGQIYAMTGMRTRLNLIADEPGDYMGLSTNFSGTGFASMHFTVHAVSKAEYDSWVQQTKGRSPSLTLATYINLRKPSEAVPPAYFSKPADHLFHRIIMQYMKPNQLLNANTESTETGNEHVSTTR